MRDLLQLAALDVAGGLEKLQALELLEQRVAFYEFAPAPKKKVPKATPTPSIVRPAPTLEAVSSSPASDRRDRRGTGTR